MMVQVTKILIIYLMADVPPNQNEKCFDIWIQYIRTVGKHSVPTAHLLTYSRNKFTTNFTAVPK